MVEKTPILDTFTYFFDAGHSHRRVSHYLCHHRRHPTHRRCIPGAHAADSRATSLVNIQAAWEKGDLGTQLINSFIMAAGITIGKIIVSMLGAFSIVYFDYRFRTVAFVTVFCTLMLPVEVGSSPPTRWRPTLFGPLE
jgi:sn-glycerol 3-phosphate transport system permease protein